MIDTTIKVAIVASIGPTLVGILNVLHQIVVARKVIIIGESVKRVETQTNGIKDALVASTALASHAEGVKDERLRASQAENIVNETVSKMKDKT